MEKRTVKEIAEYFGVTSMAVRHWLKNKNIPYEIEKVIGIKPRIIIDIEDVKKALNLKN